MALLVAIPFVEVPVLLLFIICIKALQYGVVDRQRLLNIALFDHSMLGVVQRALNLVLCWVLSVNLFHCLQAFGAKSVPTRYD